MTLAFVYECITNKYPPYFETVQHPYSAYQYYKFKGGEQTRTREKLLVRTYWPVILHSLYVFQLFY